MLQFVPGVELCREYYFEVVRPILNDAVPGLRYAAARIGGGSDVLGFDTEMSMDHDWGPRVQIFLAGSDESRYGAHILKYISRNLPAEFRGIPTRYSLNSDATRTADHVGCLEAVPLVETTTIARFFAEFLGVDIHTELQATDWLTLPEQKLRAVTSGGVFHDDVGLQGMRDRFSYFPHDVWLLLLAAGWNRIGQEEHLMGRAGFVGDELGSVIIASRLVRDIMRLCFLMERQYAPYPKWFGTAHTGAP